MTENSPGNPPPPVPKKPIYRSRILGIAFVGLSVSLLVLSTVTLSIVLEVDSVLSFLAAVVLLTVDPRRRVPRGVLDAVMTGSDRTIASMESLTGQKFIYSSSTGTAADVRAVSTKQGARGGRKVDAPGRELAVQFAREYGEKFASLEELQASLSQAMRESFGLGESVRVESRPQKLVFTIYNPAFECPLDGDAAATVGCTVASFLAIVTTLYTRNSTALEPCQRDAESGTLVVEVDLLETPGGNPAS